MKARVYNRVTCLNSYLAVRLTVEGYNREINEVDLKVGGRCSAHEVCLAFQNKILQNNRPCSFPKIKDRIALVVEIGIFRLERIIQSKKFFV